MERVVQAPAVWTDRRGETMLPPQEVNKMLALQALEWGGGPSASAGSWAAAAYGTGVPATRRLEADGRQGSGQRIGASPAVDRRAVLPARVAL
jgi:hypothetical protein